MQADWQWPSEQVRCLLEGFRAGRIGHAYVLHGSAGAGKRTLALLYGQALFCKEAQSPCGQCPPCLRVAHGNHPDSFLLTGEGSIGVEAVRGLSAALHQRAYEAGHKLVRIIGADRMTTQAQNALLKTLEEPPGRTVFLLTCEQLTALLPTIRSRCQAVFVPTLDLADAARILTGRGVPQARALLCSRMAGGAVGQALELAQDAQAWALRERTLQALSLLTSAGHVLDAAQLLREDKDRSGQVLDTMEFLARDALLGSLTQADAAEGPEQACVRRLSAIGPHAQLALLDALSRARRQLAAHLPWQTVLEALMLSWIEVLQNGEGSRRPVSQSK